MFQGNSDQNEIVSDEYPMFVNYAPLLENQIEVMLDKIMDAEHEDEDDLQFSDDDSFYGGDRDKTSHQTDAGNSLIGSTFFLNCSNISESQDQSRFPQNTFVKREGRKFPTVGFGQSSTPFQNQPLPSSCFAKHSQQNFNNVKKTKFFNQTNARKHSEQSLPLQGINNNFQHFLRSEKRRQTYECDLVNQLNCLNNFHIKQYNNNNNAVNLSVNNNSNNVNLIMNSSLNSINSFNTSSMSMISNSNINQNVNNGFNVNANNNNQNNNTSYNNNNNSLSFIIQNNATESPKLNINNSQIYNNSNNNNANCNSNKLGNAKTKTRQRFCTATFPKGTNMQIEMLLYELNTALSKTEKIDYYIYGKLQGNFVNVIKTHKGSRIFQNYLKNTHSDIIHQIFMEISPHLPEIISDSYANYFCKRFFTLLNQKDRIDFLLAIQNHLITLSMDSIGTYPIQGIIEQVGSKVEKRIIVNALQPALSELCLNTYGTHVLEKIVYCFEQEFSLFIYDYVANNFLNLAYNINGICLVKKVLTLTHKKELHEKLKKLSYENAIDLVQHSYGNYVIQVIIENWEEGEISEIISQFKGKFVYLSMQKYSSNVMERCIEKNDEILNEFIKEICESERIAEIMKNNFGNYVIQKALKISQGNINNLLVKEVCKNIFKLNDKKLILKWKNITNPYQEGTQFPNNEIVY